MGALALVIVDIVETEVPKYLQVIVDDIDVITQEELWNILKSKLDSEETCSRSQ